MMNPTRLKKLIEEWDQEVFGVLEADEIKAYDDGYKAASEGVLISDGLSSQEIFWQTGWRAWHRHNNTEWWQEYEDAHDLGKGAA